MAELVAEAFLSVAFEKLFGLLGSPEFRSFYQGKKPIDDKLRLLNENLKKARLFLNDAEERQITDQKVKEWIEELKDVIFRADDLVEDIKAEARSKQEHKSRSKSEVLKKMVASLNPFTEFDKTVQGEMENILKLLSFLIERAGTLHLKHIDGAQNTRTLRRAPAPLLEENHVHGRNTDKEEILKLLLSDEIGGNRIGVLPIVGMGGLGKTTLARLVYDDERVKRQDFHHKAWVTVSTDFDILRITKIILEQVSPQTPGTEELVELQGRLKEALRGKKFLFVLDDVWDENYENWDSLKSVFMSGDRRSRIIVTTRSRKVASNVKTGEIIHELHQVSDKDCWKIFAHHAFDGESVVDPCLYEIGGKIVEKCKGLPLAVRSIGGLLRSERNPDKWESILRNHVWSKNLRNNILPGLWLSYCCLPSRLKQCFAYCSIFPKGYEFEKEKLILLWMAEGFLQSDQKGKRMEEVGKEYFDELMARSLFQRSSQDESESTFVMHDLVHDLAMFVSGEVCFRFDDTMNLEQLTRNTRHISTGKEVQSIDHKLWKGQFDAKRLRSFVKTTEYLYYDKLVSEVLAGGRNLRVFSSSTSIEIHAFSKLKQLRYLDLSWSDIVEIPCSLCTLYNLQTLLLSNCRSLIQLPTEMVKLINLRHLDTTKTPLKEMPPQMGKLKELQSLSDFVLGEHGSGSSIQELGELHHLGGRLRISRLQNVSNGNPHKAVLMEKANLKELSLEWKGDVTDTQRATEALNALRPHTNLMKLSLHKYPGLNFPDWLGDSSFSKMVSIHLCGNKYCLFLPPLGQLPSLRELKIKGFHGVEKIGAEFFTGNNPSVKPFQSLEILEFSGLKRWKEWSCIGRDGKEGKSFPHLKEISFGRCPNLAGSLPACNNLVTLKISESYKSMESLPLDNFPKLKKLHLLGCDNLKKIIVDSPDVIESLFIEECNKLEFLGSHHFVHVRKLRINGCVSLRSLALDYFPSLKELFLSICHNLDSLTFREETGTALHSLINELVIYGCEHLKSLPEHMHRLLPFLSYLRIENCPEIVSFPEGGLPSSLNQLSIRNCCKLVEQHRHWDLERLTSLKSLDIFDSEDIALESFPEGSFPSSLTSLYLWKLPHLKSLNNSAFKNIASLENLVLEYCNELQVLPESLLLPRFLHCLRIGNCSFLERRYQKGKGEDWHKISQIPRISIYGWTTMEMESNREEDSASTDV